MKRIISEGKGAPVGLFDDAEYDEVELSLPSEFRLMLFSDGILEVLEDASLSAKEKYLLNHAPSSRADPESVLKNYAVDSTQKYPR